MDPALTEASEFLKKKTLLRPRLAVVLGSGLGAFAEEMNVDSTVDFQEIPNCPHVTNQMHAGRFLFGTFRNIPLTVIQGRLHFYEGYDMTQVVFPIRLLRLTGAETILLTNASGGIRPDLVPGSIMMITDHISSFVPSPLRGKNDVFPGLFFPDMSRAYDPDLCAKLRTAAERCSVELKEGIYVQTAGPQFETPAEIRMYRTLGADAVGMSTVCDVIAARHAGMKVCALSFVSNYAAGLQEKSLTIDEITETFRTDGKKMIRLLSEAIPLL